MSDDNHIMQETIIHSAIDDYRISRREELEKKEDNMESTQSSNWTESPQPLSGDSGPITKKKRRRPSNVNENSADEPESKVRKKQEKPLKKVTLDNITFERSPLKSTKIDKDGLNNIEESDGDKRNNKANEEGKPYTIVREKKMSEIQSSQSSPLSKPSSILSEESPENLFDDDNELEKMDDEAEIEDDTAIFDSINTYSIVKHLRYDKAQRVLCRIVDQLKNEAKQLNYKFIQRQEHINRFDCLRPLPFQPGSSAVSYHQVELQQRYLAFNHYGRISLTCQLNHVENGSQDCSMRNDIEISSSIAGSGRRKQVINNLSKHYNLGTLGPNGFILARGNIYHHHPRPQLTIPTESDSELNTESTTDNDDKKDAKKMNEKHLRKDSLSTEQLSVERHMNPGFKYRSLLFLVFCNDNTKCSGKTLSVRCRQFSTWGQLSKSRWSKTLPNDEIIEGIAIGQNHIAVMTSKEFLRIFSLAGIQLYLIRLAGKPIGITIHGDRILIISLLSSKTVSSNEEMNAQNLYFYRLIDLKSNTEIASNNLSMNSGNSIIWCGMTPKMMPILVDSMVQLPKSQMMSFDWIPILDLKEVISTPMVAQKTFDIREFVWVANALDEELQICRLSKLRPQPIVSDTPPLLSCPFRLPLALTTGDSSLSYKDWIEYKDIDPNMTVGKILISNKSENCEITKDLSRLASLSWDFFDEYRCRLSLWQNHLKFLLTLINHDHQDEIFDRQEFEKERAKLELTCDKSLFRLFMKALADSRVELALEAALMFKLPRTFQVAMNQAIQRGHKALCERLQDEIELRMATEASQSENLSPRVQRSTRENQCSSKSESGSHSTSKLSWAEELRLETTRLKRNL